MERSKKDYINYRIDKANEIFDDAKLLAQNARWNSCVNRLYYSAFHLVSALLALHDVSAESHNGIKTQFFRYFVKTNKISQEDGKLYAHLFDWRQESDYTDFIDFDKQTVLPLLNEVEELNQDLKELIQVSMP